MSSNFSWGVQIIFLMVYAACIFLVCSLIDVVKCKLLSKAEDILVNKIDLRIGNSFVSRA